MAQRLGEQRGQPGVALTPAEFQHCIDPLLSTDPSPVSTELGPFPFTRGEYMPVKYLQANVEQGLTWSHCLLQILGSGLLENHTQTSKGWSGGPEL